MERERVLALDVGEVRTGIALSDVAHTQASPLAVLDTKSLLRNNAPLFELFIDYEVRCIVVGLPLDEDGGLGRWSRRVRSLTRQLLNGLDALPRVPKVVFFDERHSSARAKEQGRILGLSERDMRGTLDSHAAAQFLQAYLDIDEECLNEEFSL